MFERTVENGAQIPRFYRVVYRDYCRDVLVCWPIGLHWIGQFGRWLWCLSFWRRPDAWERECRAMFWAIRDGYERQNPLMVAEPYWIISTKPPAVQLEPVGIEHDGTLKPVGELSYRPREGWSLSELDETA